MTKKVSYLAPRDLLIKSTQLFNEHIVAAMYLVVLPGLVYLLGTMLRGVIDPQHPVLTDRVIIGTFIAAIGSIWSVINIGPAIQLQLRALDGHNDNLRTYYRRGLPYFWRILGYYLLFVVVVVGGLILFIIPGIIFLRRYLLGPYYIVDQNMSVSDAFKRSAADSVRDTDTTNALWVLIAIQLVVLFIGVALAHFGIIAILLTQVVSYALVFSVGIRYREITPAKKQS